MCLIDAGSRFIFNKKSQRRKKKLPLLVCSQCNRAVPTNPPAFIHTRFGGERRRCGRSSLRRERRRISATTAGRWLCDHVTRFTGSSHRRRCNPLTHFHPGRVNPAEPASVTGRSASRAALPGSACSIIWIAVVIGLYLFVYLFLRWLRDISAGTFCQHPQNFTGVYSRSKPSLSTRNG